MNTITDSNIWSQPPVVAALIAGSVSLILAIWNFLTARQSQIQLELLKSELAQKKSDNDARREYEFEAKKKLYQEYEPLLFQLMEASENALGRIRSLARTARNGNLGDPSWLDHFGYYSKSTMYNLLVPLCIYRVMQRKITLVDLSVDKSIASLYKLVKQAYKTFMDEYKFAKCAPVLDYDGDHKDESVLKLENETKYWKQGLPMGILDKAIEYLMDGERIISYGEFEKKLDEDKDEGEDHELFYLREMLLRFHPQKRHVLWRVLLGQALIYTALLKMKNKSHTNLKGGLLKLELNSDEYERFLTDFEWAGNDQHTVELEYKAALEYMQNHYRVG